MKKRVRILKTPTSFAMGGQSYTQDDLITAYLTVLSQDGSSTEDAENLLRENGVDESTIKSITDAVEEYADGEKELNSVETDQTSDDYADVSAEQAALDNATALEQAEEEARSARMQAMYDNYGYDDNTDFSDDYGVASDIVASKKGGTPSKRTFLNNVMKLLKKEEGGPQQNNAADSTDVLDGRRDNLNAFVSALQQNSNESAMKDDALAAYQQYQMDTMPIGGGESYYDPEDLDYAQFGMNMSPGKQRRVTRRLNRLIRKLPVGFQGAMPGVYTLPSLMPFTEGFTSPNLVVERYGLFGQPKEYTMNFGDPRAYINMMNNPRAAEEVIMQEQKNAEQTSKDVAQGELESKDKVLDKTTNEEGDEEIVDINDIQVVGSNARESYRGDGVEVPRDNVKTDKWGRSADDRWYGFDPSTKTWSKDRWGRNPDDDWYGFDPSTKEWTTAKKSAPPKKAASSSSALPKQDLSNDASKSKSNSSRSWEAIVDYPKIRNTFEDLGRQLTPSKSVKKALGLNKLSNTLSDLYESLPDAPSEQQLVDWGILSGYDPIHNPTGLRQQEGGITDQASGLYKFMNGGDDISIPQVGELTNDPYFAEGGLYRFQGENDSQTDKSNTNANNEMPTWFKQWASQNVPSGYRDPYSGWDGTGSMPFITTANAPKEWRYAHPEYYNNPYSGYGYDPYMMMAQALPAYTTQQRGLPFLTNTGQRYLGDLAGAIPAQIKVNKSFALGPQRGLPKKYEINYRVPASSLAAAQANQPKKGLGRLFNRDQNTIDMPEDQMTQTDMSGSPMFNAAYALSNTPGLRWLGAQALKKVRIPGDFSVPDETFQKRAMENAMTEGYTEFPSEVPKPTETVQNVTPEAPAYREDLSPFTTNARENALNEGYTEIPKEFYPVDETSKEGVKDFAEPIGVSPSGVPFVSRPDIPYLQENEIGAMSPDQIAQLQAAQLASYPLGTDILTSREYEPSQDASVQDFLLNQTELNNPYFDTQYGVDYENMPYTGPASLSNSVIPQEFINNQRSLGRKVRSYGKSVPVATPKRPAAPIASTPASIPVPPKAKVDSAPSNRESQKIAFTRNRIADIGNTLEESEGFSDLSLQDRKSLRATYNNDIAEFKKLPLDSQYRLIKTLSKSKNPTSREKAYILAESVRLNYAEGGPLPKAQQWNSITGKSPIFHDPRFSHIDAPAEFEKKANELTNQNPFDYLYSNRLSGQKTMGLDESGEKLRNDGLLEDYSDPSEEYVDVTAKFRNKRNRTQEDNLAFLNYKNAIGNFLVSSIDGRGDRRKRLQQYLRTIPQDTTGLYDRGNEQINAIGNTMVADTGFRGINAGSTAKYGGYYKEGGQTWMTPKQIADYLARGGEIEFI